ncbi:hypothetical protein P280DRAFT_495422 [Massarina eburnea CBS 473.64]|uniref:Formylmethionine deformylase-like protein n=1 Tax=Massarina eburnea CBS 473.64 TaxID=1395130 RepID=A0A6A6SFD8_9PLEO|nr:hypothetical protein P280DRAFT_495422 [Massarina eburnea CBS 473.64]
MSSHIVLSDMSKPQQPSNSLYTVNSLSQYKTQDEAAQRLVDRRAGELAQWHIHWITPAMALALFVAGAIGSIGHHVFYTHLDGKPADEQLRMVRYGTALAFFVKSTLVGSVVTCYRQRIWRTFRKTAMTMSAIDSLFTATEAPAAFFNWEMIMAGKLATFMALCSWLIPLASVLSPSSLTSELREIATDGARCASVATLNFTREAKYDFRKEDSYAGASLAFWNTTDVKGETPGFFDYYDQPSKNGKRLAVTSIYLNKPATNPSASLNSCGERWNCTYDLTFEAPGYKCDDVASSSKPDAGDAPFNLSIMAPQGDMTYYASTDLNDYVSPQIDTGTNGEPKQKPPYPGELGVFQSEPVLWIGYSIKTSEPYDKDSPYREKWGNVHEPKIFKCVAHHTNYTFEMRYNDTQQSHKLKKRDFLYPVVDTQISPDPRNSSKFLASPASSWVSPRTDKEKYKITACYHSLGALLRNFLRGQIKKTQYLVTKSDISESRLMDPKTSYVVPNLKEEIQNVFEDILISLLSEPHLVVADTQNVPCVKSRSVNVFVYHREGLWIGYAFAVFAAFCFLLVGAWSIHQNGVASDTRFSRIMVTTRNPTLDQLSVGACLGGDPFPKELTRTKLRFGVLLEENPREGPLGVVEHCCFGSAGEVKEISKSGKYAGLKKYRDKLDAKREDGDVKEKAALLREDSEGESEGDR